MKGVLPWLIHWACCAGTRDFCPALAGVLKSASIKYFFLTGHYSSSIVPFAQQVGHAFVLHSLSLYMVLRDLLLRMAAPVIYII